MSFAAQTRLSTVPRTTIWTHAGPREGSTNWGSTASMNTANLGFSTVTTKPCQQMADSGCGRADPSASGSRETNSLRIPNTTRYAEPTYFTTANQVADEASNADSPAAAAITWTAPPANMPASETTPALYPWLRLRATT